MKHQIFSRFLSVILIVMLAVVALPVTPARAATFTVTKTADTNDGTCSAADCSLREAIIAANGAAGADTITLPAGTYALSRVGTDDNSNNGDLDITDGVGTTDITLTGAGSGSTTITGAVGWADRIFDVRASATVSISGVTISGGNINNANGGGILKNGNGSLTLTNVVLSGNAATGNPAQGGGLYSNDGTVTITNGTVSGNSSARDGGGLYINNGTVTITNSTISNNSSARGGGGIFANNGVLSVTLSALNSNTAGREGGAINTNATTTISNTTITANSVTGANRDGGGLWANANTTVINSVFSGNTTIRNGGNVFRNAGTVSFRNTILNAGSPENCSGTITNTGTNIDSGSTCFTATNGSLINTNPNLGALTGSPAYFPLNTGSPAIDAGNNTACATAPVSNASQNGLTRPLDGNGDTTLTCDIGSYEAPTALIVTTTLITADTPEPSLVGETVAVTVTVSGGATPTGTVDITGADTNCSITLAGGTGSCNVTFTSVGAKTLTATYIPDATHAASSDTEPHTVNQATSTVTVTCPVAAQPYTGSAQTPCTASYSTSDGLSGSLTPTYSNNINVGTATANATYAGDANHAGSSNSATFDISQATSSVTVTCPASVIYTGSAQSPCTASYSTSDGLSGSLTPTYSNNTNVGTATANATYAGDANHAGSSNSATFDISQATSTVTVTCPAAPQPYTGSAQTPCTASYSTSDGLSGSLTPTYSNNTNVGTATANATYAGDANHAGSSSSATFDISQATSTVTVTCPTSVIYNGSAQTPCTASYSTSDGLSGSLTPTYSNNTNVGTATANAAYAGDVNHAGSSNSATFDISQAASTVTVTCPAAPQPYTGSAQTPCTASYSTSDGLSGSLTPTYSNNTNVGTATANATYAGDANHAGSSNSATFDIRQATSTVTVTCPTSVIYNGSAQTPCTDSYSTSDGLSGSLTPTYSNNTNVGTATANAAYAGDANHAGSSNSATFDISQATSTVTVTCPASVIYTGSAQTPCTASYSTSDGLSGSLTPTYSNNTNVGTATANAAYAGDANHAGSSNSATFDISQATSTVTVTCPASVIYNGSAQTPCTASYSTSDGLSGSLTPTYSNNTNVGTATANATYVGDANHAGSSNSATFDISQATSTVTVTCPAAPQPYTGSAQTPCTASYSTSDGLSGSLTPTYSNNTNVGTATANATYAGDANHAGSSNSGTFDISQATSTVTVTCPASVIYNGSAQTPCTASYSTSDGLSGSLTPTYSNNTNVGTATANATYAGDANHAGSSNSATFDISQATSTVTVTCPASVIYNGSAQTPCTASYSTSDGLNGSLTPAYSNNTNVGTATANATYAGDANHAGSSNSATFDISQATSTVTVTCPISVPYTGSAQTPCTAEATGAGMSPVDVSVSLVYSNNINVGAATADASWGGDANHTGNSGSGGFTIGQATSTVTVTCPVSVPYTGSAQTPCTAEATGAGMSPVDVSASLVYSNNINVGIATADASWGGDASHTGSSGSGSFAIGLAAQTITVITSAPATASNGSTFDVAATASSGLPVTITTSGVCTGGDTDGTATVTMTSGTGTCSVFYDQAGNGNYLPAPKVQEDVTATEGPSFTSADNTSFDMGFPGAFTVTAVGNPSTMTITLTGGTLPAGVTLTDNGDGTAILQGTPAAGTSGTYSLVFTADNGVLPNGTQNFTLTVRNGPTIGADGINSIPETSGGSVIENESILDTLGITHLLVEFSQDVYNPAGDTDPDDVTNPANYMLVRTPDGVFSTVSCAGGVVAPDVSISVDSVTYSNGGGSGPYIATLAFNGGFPLNVVGFHRLYVCGTTSIVDANNTNLVLAGNGTNPATDFQRNFSIVVQGGGGGGGGGGAGSGSQIGGNFLIPVTGFAPHQTAPLPAQPADKVYKLMGEMTLEIPSLAIKYPIVGASITNKSWDLTWLQNSVAYLEGSAYPTMAGNTVLTAHVLDANNNLGPFSDIKGMRIGQKIYIHVNGQTYVYQVQENQKILPTSISKVFKHEEDSWITLVTCEDFNAKTGLYATRRMVRAVLISVIPAKK